MNFYIKKIKHRFQPLLLLALVSCPIAKLYATTVADLPSWKYHQMTGQPSLRGSALIGDSMWVTGSNNSVFVSQDGGKNWLNKSVTPMVDTDFRDIELFDKDTAIVMGVGNGQQSALYKTTDSGDSWHLLYQNKDDKGFFDSIAFWDKSNGLLLGDPVDGFYVIKKTEDGGKTWRRIARTKIPEMLEKEAAFAASGNTLIVGKKGKAWITTGGFSASVYHSNDYGESWQRESVPLYNETQTAGGYGLGLNHKQDIFVVGGDYQQRPAAYSNAATMINGQWQKVNSREQGLRTAFSCQGNICLMTGKNNSDISFNAGSNWQPVINQQAKEGNKGFYTLASDNFVFLAAGADGKVGVLSFKRKN